MEAVRAHSEAVVQQLVDAGAYASTADAVADDVQHLVELARHRLTGDAMIAGYQRVPQADDEVAVARATGVRSIAAEPW